MKNKNVKVSLVIVCCAKFWVKIDLKITKQSLFQINSQSLPSVLLKFIIIFEYLQKK
ncbi:MAG: hypothetical protein ACJAYJ_003611 [Saprospiraceae bacterium]|jgi:hypothetical protein